MFLQQKSCLYSKEPPLLYCSFEYKQHIFKLRDTKKISFFAAFFHASHFLSHFYASGAIGSFDSYICISDSYGIAEAYFNSATTIYLSYSYNPVATNTNLRAVTLVYPCSGLNIDSNDVTDYRN